MLNILKIQVKILLLKLVNRIKNTPAQSNEQGYYNTEVKNNLLIP